MEKLKLHPWLKAEGGASEASIKQTVAEKIMKAREEKRKERQASSRQGTREAAYKRGDDDGDEKFIASTPFTQPYNNADLTEWGTFLKPAEMWEQIEIFAGESGSLEAERDENKKKFELIGTENNVRIKVKFFDSPEEKTLKVSFIKKQGDLLEFYKVLKEAQEFL